MFKSERQFTAVYRKAGKWYLGWIEEIPGVNTQGKTLKEAKDSLKDALLLVLETNKIISSAENYGGNLVREKLEVEI